MNTVAGYEEVDSTADLCLHVWGLDLAELFAQAAEGLFDLLGCEASDGAIPVVRHIALQALDAEYLLVQWLNELLYLREPCQELYEQFLVGSVSPCALVATVRGLTHCPAGRCIKAATFHNLRIGRTERGYETVITLDV